MSIYEVKNHLSENKNDDFEVDSVEIIEAKTKRDLTQTITRTCITFLVGAALYGIFKGNFNELSAVWSTIQTIIGIIIAYYFGREHGKRNDTRSNGVT